MSDGFKKYIDCFRSWVISTLNQSGLVEQPAESNDEWVMNTLKQAAHAHQQGRWNEAKHLYEAVLQQNSRQVDALHLLGLVYHQQGLHEKAIPYLAAAIDLAPQFAVALINFGVVLRAAGRQEEALHRFNQGLALTPNNYEGLNNRGLLFLDLHRLDDALADFQASDALLPEQAPVWGGRGTAYFAKGDYEQALRCYEQAIRLEPREAKHYLNQGNTLKELQRYDAAIAAYLKAIEINPQYAIAHQNLALTYLLMGNYVQGWQEYEWRWQGELAGRQLQLLQPRWLGHETLQGKKILIYAEQGFGDILQFSRFLPAIKEKGASIVLYIPQQLEALFTKLNIADRIVTQQHCLPETDFYCPLMSLPLALNIRCDADIPLPILSSVVDGIRPLQWMKKFEQLKGWKVGVFWNSTTTHTIQDNQSINALVKTNLALRNIPISHIKMLFDLPANFFVLQKEVSEEDLAVIHQYTNVTEMSHELQDFVDTAAVIDRLDLVITIDTAVAHLAASLNKPVWILLPYNADWRWLILRSDTPWYSTASLFRQKKPHCWGDVIIEIKDQFINNF